MQRYPESHFRRVAEIYTAAVTAGSHRANVDVAEVLGVSAMTARSWVKRARELGFLSASCGPGRAGSVQDRIDVLERHRAAIDAELEQLRGIVRAGKPIRNAEWNASDSGHAEHKKRVAADDAARAAYEAASAEIRNVQ